MTLLSGSELFGLTINYFGRSNITGIRGYWVGGDNLATFNSVMATGKYTEAEAARLTFTGKVAGSYGFTSVEVVSTSSSGGKYTKVEVIFR